MVGCMVELAIEIDDWGTAIGFKPSKYCYQCLIHPIVKDPPMPLFQEGHVVHGLAVLST